jgi:hypothetical protein
MCRPECGGAEVVDAGAVCNAGERWGEELGCGFRRTVPASIIPSNSNKYFHNSISISAQEYILLNVHRYYSLFIWFLSFFYIQEYNHLVMCFLAGILLAYSMNSTV